MEVGARTDIGLRKSVNEDSYEVWFTTIDGVERGIFAVADGVGGEEKGEIASKEVLSVVYKHLYPVVSAPEKPKENFLEELLDEAIKQANTDILTMAHERGIGKMATTLTMGVVIGSTLIAANVGDSRTCVYRDDKLHKVTVDHSLIEHLVERGKLNREDVEVPRSERAKMHENIVTRALGDKEHVDVDIFQTYLYKGDQILFCCDGLTDLVPTEDIVGIMKDSPSANECCIRLVQEANDKGGKDNITVIVARPEYLSSADEVMKGKTVVKEDQTSKIK